MTDASKGRELYVEFYGDPAKDWENYKRYCGAEKFNSISPSDEVIRFIEYSAFILVQNELKAVREKLRIASGLLGHNAEHNEDCHDADETFSDDECCECGATEIQRFLATIGEK